MVFGGFSPFRASFHPVFTFLYLVLAICACDSFFSICLSSLLFNVLTTSVFSREPLCTHVGSHLFSMLHISIHLNILVSLTTSDVSRTVVVVNVSAHYIIIDQIAIRAFLYVTSFSFAYMCISHSTPPLQESECGRKQLK